MCTLENFILDLQFYLCGNKCVGCNIIRKHTKRLEQLGDISFPLNTKNWFQLLDKEFKKDSLNIFDNNIQGVSLDLHVQQMKEMSKNWHMKIGKVTVDAANVYVFLEKSPDIFRKVLKEVLDKTSNYGSSTLLLRTFLIETRPNLPKDVPMETDLSCLRLGIIKSVSLNLLDCVTAKQATETSVILLTLNQLPNSQTSVLCNPVINERGVKSTTTVQELYQKRASDMRMMAQHKYGIQIKSDSSWKSYFETLGKASVIIEMLSNKPQKSLKITLNDLQNANKGSSFIFYNCARLATLLREFHKRVSAKTYPELTEIENVDFSQLVQPEEWELFYVYIMQYPIVVKNCIKDIEKGILNPQYLISFLLSLSSVFSIYYRRIKILTDPREHLFTILHARIYLLSGIQYVFHHALSLMNIQPISRM